MTASVAFSRVLIDKRLEYAKWVLQDSHQVKFEPYTNNGRADYLLTSKKNDDTQYLRDGRAPKPKNVVTSKIMSSIRAKNTKPEIFLRKALYASGYSGYRLHWKKVPGKPDIAYPGKKLAIFVNGCFWHRCPNCNPPMPRTHKRFWKEKFTKNIERDQRKTRQLEQLGWKVIILWECQIRNDISKCINIVRATLLNINL